jgi:hypothetical protein
MRVWTDYFLGLAVLARQFVTIVLEDRRQSTELRP